MDHDFLDGIDEHFEQLMKLRGNGRNNGRRNGRSRDRTLAEIMEELDGMTSSQKHEVLSFIQSLRGDSEPTD
jgi:hypothetical protein